MAEAPFEGDEAQVRGWVEPLLHQLRRGGEAGGVNCLEGLLEVCREWEGGRRTTVVREVGYFQSHRERLHYEQAAAAAQLPDRFKRRGQFWSPPGERALLALELARRNEDWDEIWELDSKQC